MPSPSQSSPTVESLLRLIEVRDAEVALLKLTIEKLKATLLRRTRAQFGVSSEQLDIQLSLIASAPPDASAAKPAKATAAADGQNAGQNAANDPAVDRKLPEHLPRETVTTRPEASSTHHDSEGQACGCTACGGRLRQIGQDVSEQLEYVPGHFKVLRHVRPKLACVSCESIFQASAAGRPIRRGVAGAALLAQVMVAKYCDHLPLHRQSRIYARSGVQIERSTMAGWVEQTEQLLTPLLDALGRYTLAGPKLHGDDTPVAVLAPGQGKTKTGRLWAYVRDDRPAGSKEPPAVWLRYSPDRKGEHPQQHLRGFAGILQADAYGGWGKLYDSGNVTEVACWAHARRPWWDLYLSTGKSPDSVAAQALGRIAQLYAIEAQIRGKPPEERRQHRQSRAGPVLDELHQWLSAMVGRVSAKSELARAIGYTLTRWQALTRYRDDGRIEIDNNAAERALRGVAVGRGNYLFMGSDAGGERAAAMYSLVETAKLNGLDPFAYLREVIGRIGDHPINRVDELLPWNIGADDRRQRREDGRLAA